MATYCENYAFDRKLFRKACINLAPHIKIQLRIFEIHIFENIILKQIPELMEMALILKTIHLRESFMETHSLTSLAQLSKTLIVSKHKYSNIMCLNKFQS